ncbi:MAG: hypothetical protein E7596_07275 [Ruminococcaceae bacterium]|nr:hypothetical protein [Oscillospiraceae bacterium]
MGEKKAVSINIISSCICRDCFEIAKRELMNHEYKIDLFYQAISPLSIYSKTDEELLKITENDLVFGTPWMKRLILADFRKNPFDSIEERKDTFLLLDLSDLARALYRLFSDDSAYIINTDMVTKNTEVIKKYVKCTVYPWELPKEYVEECIDRFVDDLSKRYDSDKTILCKIHHAGKYLSKDGKIGAFSTPVSTYNEFIDYCTDCFIKAYAKKGEGLHIIEMPENALAYELHKWGNYSRHYCNEYYEYLLASIDCCVSQYDKETEKKILDILLSKCERDFERIYTIAELKERVENSTATIKEKDAILKDRDAIIKEKDAIIKEKDLVDKENIALNEELRNIRVSKSFKIGRFLTYIPRKLRRKK